MDQQSTISTSRTLQYSPAAIYSAFASSELLASWWGPDGFTNTFEIFEFRVGGRWKFLMHSPDGKSYANESVFSALKPDSTIVIDHIVHPHYTLRVTLLPDGPGTRLTWNQTFKDSKTANGLRHIVGPANEQNLDRLTLALGTAKSAA